MPAELVFLNADMPRYGFATALIHDTDTDKFTTVIVNEQKAATFIIQPLEDALISFGQSRRTQIQDFEFISQEERKSREFSGLVDKLTTEVFTAPLVARTQPVINTKNGDMHIWTQDIDTGWVRVADAAHFASSEILLANRKIDHNKYRPKAYLIEIPAYTLMALELGFHQFYYYYSNMWPTKEFFVGRSLYTRTSNGKFVITGGYDPNPDVCKEIKNDKMQAYLQSRGVI